MPNREQLREQQIEHMRTRERARVLAIGHHYQGLFIVLASVAWIIFLLLLSNWS